MSVETAPRCANHPSVETYVSCSSCGKPICPDCMVQSAVGIKCRDCARMPRSAQVRLRPAKALRAVVAALAIGIVIGVVLAAVRVGGLGFFAFFIAVGIGILVGEGTKRAAGYFRGEATGWIAAGGCLLAYVTAWALEPVFDGGGLATGGALVLQLALGCMAGFVAFRRVT